MEYLLQKINRELGMDIKSVEEGAIRRMVAYPWPGNVRELENVLTKAALVTQGDVILEEDIASLLSAQEETPKGSAAMSLEEVEREHILKVLQYAGWHYGKTCKLLGISRPTLRQKMKKYGISPPGRRL